MKPTQRSILTINGGSSSIKFALYEIDAFLKQLLSGEIENIGSGNTKLSFNDFYTDKKNSLSISADNFADFFNYFII